MAAAAREATAGSFSILQDETEKRRNHAVRIAATNARGRTTLEETLFSKLERVVKTGATRTHAVPHSA